MIARRRQSGAITYEVVMCFVSVALILWVKYLSLENRDLKAQLLGAQSVVCAQAVAAAPAAPSDSQCMGWLFDSDLAKTKARICGQKEKSPGAK